MRFALRSLAGLAASVALVGGVAGCQENNEANVLSSSEGKSSVDPKAPKSIEELKPKGGVMPPPPGVSISPPQPGAPAAKAAAPAKDAPKDMPK